MIIAGLRRLRHGPLKFLGPIWGVLGNLYRRFSKFSGLVKFAETKIGTYGPFKLNAMFAFSDYEHWGDGHNNGFAKCIESCRGKLCVLDIGGHIGLVSLPVSKVLAKGGRVFAFEPSKANRQMLQEHADINALSNIEVVEHLVGAEEKESVEFFENPEPSGMNSVVISKHHDAYTQVTKRQITVDGFCHEQGLRPDVIKIDVEGAELGVLRGARETLKRAHPTIFLSVHPREIGLLGESLEGLSALIKELGYECRNVDGSHVEEFALQEYILTPE